MYTTLGGRVVKTHHQTRGFTLIELMIVVAILGLLAAVAIPAFNRAVRKTKNSEAVVNLRRMFDGAVTSFQSDEVNRVGQGLAGRFPVSVAPSPGIDACCNHDSGRGICPGTADSFSAPTWQELQFAITDPHYFWYEFASEGQGATARFTARASGNLDCDDLHSTFERLGYIDLMEGIVGGAGLYTNKPLE